MSDEPDKQKQPNTNTGDAQQIYTLIGRLIYNFFNNPKFLDLLTAKPLIGNLIVASLVTFTGFSIFGENNSEKIDAQSMCEKTKTEVALQLKVDSSKIKDLSAEPTSSKSNIKNQLFSCKYNIQEEPRSGLGNPSSSSREYHVVYQVLRNELVANIKEEKIATDSLQEVCQDETIYTKQLLARKQYNPKEHKIIKEGLELQQENTVYPVFRWKCKYKVIPKVDQPLDKPGSQYPSIPVGLNLDVFCRSKFGKENLTKATHHYYNDPDSLYCVNPNF